MSTSSVWRVVFTSSVCVSPRADGLADGLGVLICQQLSWPDAERLSLAIPPSARKDRSEEHTSELQSQSNLVCRLLLEKKKKIQHRAISLSFLSGCVRTWHHTSLC